MEGRKGGIIKREKENQRKQESKKTRKETKDETETHLLQGVYSRITLTCAPTSSFLSLATILRADEFVFNVRYLVVVHDGNVWTVG